MKKLILLIQVTTALVTSGYCQADTSLAKINKGHERDQYSVKAKKQKTTAWICLGGGVALATTGLILGSTKAAVDFKNIAVIQDPHPGNYTGESILMLLGAGGITASIPLFVDSGKNKQKAKLMATLLKTAEGLPDTVAKNVAGLTLSIKL